MTFLGKYELHEILGKGGFGTVYRATDSTLDRVVALKVLHPVLAVESDFIERFRREARLIAKLDHPGIVTIYEIGEDEGRFFIAMKYLPGGSLATRIANGPLSFAQATPILLQVCAGLQTAHAQGLVHRDIKPANILFDAGGQAVISDFGLARLLSTTGAQSSFGVVGTPFYRAPELWQENVPCGPAADVYSLGCVLVEMLTGLSPFRGNTPEKVLTRHLIEGPDFGPIWPPPGAPMGLEALVARALAKDPSQRFADAAALAEALQNLYTVVPHQESIQQSGKLLNWLSIYRRSVILAGLALIGLGGVIFASMNLPPGMGRPLIGSVSRGVTPGLTSDLALTGSPGRPPVLLPTVTLPPTTTSSVTPSVTPTVTSSATRTPSMTPTIVPATPPAGMVLIPAGPFLMGSDKGEIDERPIHYVTLDAFWMDIYEVTNADYLKCVNAGKCKPTVNRLTSASPTSSFTRSDYYTNPQYANYPVLYASWDNADIYCRSLGKRLPGEAEWEKAARGGLEGKQYPWGDTEPTCTFGMMNGMQSDRCTIKDTVAVGSFAPNDYGLYDMLGNVWEWTNSLYESYGSVSTRNAAPSASPSTPISPSPSPTLSNSRVLRGGGWSGNSALPRIADRYYGSGNQGNPGLLYIGFRCAMSLKTPE